MSAIMPMSAMTTGPILAMRGQRDDCCGALEDPGFCEVAFELDGTGVTPPPEPESGSDCNPPGAAADFHEPLEPAGARDESVSRFSRFKSPRNSAAVW